MTDQRIADLTDALDGPDGLRFVRAPGRVNLIGDHTDYQDGFCLPMAIDRDCLVGLRPTDGGRVRARSLELSGTVDVAADGSDDARSVEPRWGGFVAGAVQTLVARGGRVPGLDLVVSSTVPAGSGLSSSSALSVALTMALGDTAGLELDANDVARAALDAEVRATGVPGGLMDQLASVHGVADHALLIDCRTLAVEPIPLPREVAVLVVHSGVPRTLAGSAYAERRAATERAATRLGIASLRDANLRDVQDDAFARHVVTENARVLAFAAALRDHDVGALGPLLLASHASLRDDFAVSTPELDLLVDAFVAAGALGARLTGAGFGGCVVGLALATKAPRVLDRTVERYRSASGREPSAFVVQAVEGAGRVGP
ncbi:MAG: galactokinase [Acidimicrobiia bacterium]|nr:galactokinase [Acidimicrobiia bacterium]